MKFFLTVGKSTALVFLAVLTGLSIQPELAQLSLDLLLPSVLHLGRGSAAMLGLADAGGHGRRTRVLASADACDGRFEAEVVEVDAFAVRSEWTVALVA